MLLVHNFNSIFLILLQKLKAFANLVFPNAIVSVLPDRSLKVGTEPMAHGIMTSVTQGAMSGILQHFL